MRNSLVNSWSKNALRLAITVSLASPLAPIPMAYAQDHGPVMRLGIRANF
jgi:hypothetical protein